MMGATFFISSRLKFRSKIVTASIAISYTVMIVATAISFGFRNEIREGLSDICGDIQLVPLSANIMDEKNPVRRDLSYLPELEKVEGVGEIEPVIYRAGIIKEEDRIHGVVFKGVRRQDTVSLGVSIPRRLAEIGNIEVGDRMSAYFVGDKVKARRFNVVSIYDPVVQADDKLMLYADIEDLRRLNGWSEDEVSAIEVKMLPSHKTEGDITYAAETMASMAYSLSSEEDGTVLVLSSIDRYPELFDWLNLIDFNVLFILILMMIVAGFNMISGLLILLFENISTIGLFKSVGMTDKSIAKVFLASSSALVLKGMAIGNALALLFCIVQNATHFLKLDPANYFVPFVPVHLDLSAVVLADIVSFIVIMLFTIVPCFFIAKVDPAESVRVR